ncbi:MAG: uncharacterized protein KVP18_000062 [Porospora cf. gigantea A]|uniref:uncharacterized protein n=1 Tax=Porospora cf. gigantea A TaxID=2853593 RepID=UPI00355A07CD|nr:MAG: hypothetical protein KVP18_000062 [Porospora cf. gigantea A]
MHTSDTEVVTPPNPEIQTAIQSVQDDPSPENAETLAGLLHTEAEASEGPRREVLIRQIRTLTTSLEPTWTAYYANRIAEDLASSETALDIPAWPQPRLVTDTEGVIRPTTRRYSRLVRPGFVGMPLRRARQVQNIAPFAELPREGDPEDDVEETIGDVQLWRPDYSVDHTRAFLTGVRFALHNINANKGCELKALRKQSRLSVFQDLVGAEPECVVCADAFKSLDIVRVLNCGHAFHVDCIDIWLESKRTCPMCRQKMELGPDEVI